jgi:hypothetical protein
MPSGVIGRHGREAGFRAQREAAAPRMATQGAIAAVSAFISGINLHAPIDRAKAHFYYRVW